MEEKEEKFINMNIRSATTIKLRATYEYKKAKLESKYQNGYDWYFIIHKGDDGDYVTSTLEKIDGTIPFPIDNEVREDVLDFCDRHSLR